MISGGRGRMTRISSKLGMQHNTDFAVACGPLQIPSIEDAIPDACHLGALIYSQHDPSSPVPARQA
jgi:hypothetical protein